VIKFVIDLTAITAVFTGYSGFLLNITEILLKETLNTINQTNQTI